MRLNRLVGTLVGLSALCAAAVGCVASDGRIGDEAFPGEENLGSISQAGVSDGLYYLPWKAGESRYVSCGNNGTGNCSAHNGQWNAYAWDFTNPGGVTNWDVLAVAAGTVTAAVIGGDGAKTVVLDHGNGVGTMYVHLNGNRLTGHVVAADRGSVMRSRDGTCTSSARLVAGSGFALAT